MMFKEVLDFAGQYGLPTVLLFVVGYAYHMQQRRHEEERKSWDIERSALYKERLEEAAERVTDVEKLGERALQFQEIQLSMVNKTSEMLAQSNQRERELREEQRERDRERERAARELPTRTR